jgi:phosphoserine phosphatase
MIRLVVCDWNGTIVRDRMEEAMFVGLCAWVFFRRLARGRWLRAARLILAGMRCARHYAVARRRPRRVVRHVGRIVKLLNPVVFRGLPETQLRRYLDGYARRMARRVDERVIRAVSAYRRRSGARVAVLSSGCAAGIAGSLARCGFAVDEVLANRFVVRDGVVRSFELRVGDDKAGQLLDLCKRFGVSPAETAYVGDSRQDEECLSLAGLPIASFFVRPEAMGRFERLLGVRRPRDEKDLLEMLTHG